MTPRPRKGHPAPVSYLDIESTALAVVKPGGILLTRSCTGLVSGAVPDSDPARRLLRQSHGPGSWKCAVPALITPGWRTQESR